MLAFPRTTQLQRVKAESGGNACSAGSGPGCAYSLSERFRSRESPLKNCRSAFSPASRAVVSDLNPVP